MLGKKMKFSDKFGTEETVPEKRMKLE